MLLTNAKFKEFTPKEVCDATKSTEVLVALSSESRPAVDDFVRKAIAAEESAPIAIRRITGSCIPTDFKTWMVISGKSSTWNRCRLHRPRSQAFAWLPSRA